ncbi:MAG: isoleucine--tRNA ligase [Phycisphaerales bacterium]|nr:isoleucine--tRNA ligase [Phycisphaerales bacterium]
MNDSTASRPANDTRADDKNAYRATLNLPRTDFPMKANLVQNEPASQKRWEQMDLYGALRKARRGCERFVFHDGPPYANGSIHLGHMMNKCLKDFVVRSQHMMGRDCPFVPGWDCHGLPIEHKVMTELLTGDKAKKLESLPDDQRKMAIRRECQKYAEKFQRHQAAQMQRLLTLGDYADPYLTMKPAFEGATLEVLASLLEQGLVYRALKAVHWSVANETALAEAELEYEDREDLSVYVDFEAADSERVYDAFNLPARADDDDEEEVDEAPPAARTPEGRHDWKNQPERVDVPRPGVRPLTRPSFMIWTTTPWTLPANLALAVNPRFTYALVWIDGAVTVLAEALVEKVTKMAKAEQVVVLATTSGEQLVGMRYRHPFRAALPEFRAEPRRLDTNAVWTLVAADYVTLEDGTGLVHTAPGHGAEDYQTGLREALPIYCPVRENGTYDDTAPDWLRGLSVWEANAKVADHLRDSGHLYFSHTFTHSYPHDWRGKSPVIFRATEQWFVGVDRPTRHAGRSLRDMAMQSIGETARGAVDAHPVRFVPEWGQHRMRGMLESRPDWCISRQRAWGLPIPAFFTPEGECFMTAASVRAVAAAVRERGSDAWFQCAPAQLLARYNPASDPDLSPTLAAALAGGFDSLRKGRDILDVWFESGSSWNAVMRERSEGRDFPVELYLEGSDQHRGWFQTSLLPALGMMGRPPYKAILTHGFMVDKDGRKMSKSLGNTLEVEELLKSHGADVCRWWVASLAYEADVKVDKAFFDVAGESYRKVRNTLRFMLSNLADFQPSCDGRAGHCVSLKSLDPASLDAWVLGEFDALAQEVIESYARYDFQRAQRRLYDFCSDTLSAVYLAAVKDRLYCDRADSPRRRTTQTVLFDLTDGLCRLLAPVLCHTADEAFGALHRPSPGEALRCVHLEEFLHGFNIAADSLWPEMMRLRAEVMQAIEHARKEQSLDNPLDMGVVLPADRNGHDLGARFDLRDLADLFGVSRVSFEAGLKSPRITDLRDQPRCDRSWKRDGTVRRRGDGGMLSDRDAEAVGVA